MNKKIIQLITVFLLGIGLLSCEKHDLEKPIQFPQELCLESITATSEVRLFTNKTEITDPSLIAAFADTSVYLSFQDHPIYPGAIITFLTPDTATFGSWDNKFEVNKTEDRWLFYSKEPRYVDIGDSLFYRMTKYRPPMISTPDRPWATMTKEVLVGYGDYRTLTLAVAGIKLHRGVQGVGYYHVTRWSGWLNNEFNPEVIAHLGATDTLAIRTYLIKLEAK